MKYILIAMLMITTAYSSTYKFGGIEVSGKISNKVIDLRRPLDREKKKELEDNGYICKIKAQLKFLCSKKVKAEKVPERIKIKILKKYKDSALSFGQKYQDDELVSDAPALKEYNVFRRIEFTRGDETLVDAETYRLLKLNDCLEKIHAKDNATAKDFWANIRKKKISRFEQYNVTTKDGYDKYLVNIKFKRKK